MDEARENMNERYNIQVNIAPRGGAQVLVQDKLAGFSEVFCFSPREVELMHAVAGNDAGVVSRHLADYTLRNLFAPRAEARPLTRTSPDRAFPGAQESSLPEGKKQPPPRRQTIDESSLYPFLSGLSDGPGASIEAPSPPAARQEECEPPPAQRGINVESLIETLEREMAIAARLERYDEAVRLRDRIAELRRRGEH